MDDKLKKAYELATQMDEQGQEWQQEQQADKVGNFLNTIAMIESSGGKNFNHPTIRSGIHKGHNAAGTYGLMPNTVYEMLNRIRRRGELSPELQELRSMEPQAVKSTVESDRELENYLASELADKVLTNQLGDEEKGAYSWFQGHNLSPKEVEDRGYKDHDYVQKYNKYKGSKDE